MATLSTQRSFESILDTPVAAVERPKPLPAGTYQVIVRGQYEEGLSEKKKTPFVRFTYAIQAAADDVDEDELAALLTDKDGKTHPLSDKTIKDTYYTTQDSLFRLTKVLDDMQIEGLEEKTIRQSLSETPNCTLMIVVSHRASEDGENIFAEIKRTMRAD